MEVLCEEEDTCFCKSENDLILFSVKEKSIAFESNHLSITREFVLMKISCSRDCFTLIKALFSCLKEHQEEWRWSQDNTRRTWRRSLCTFWASSRADERVATLSSIWPTWTQNGPIQNISKSPKLKSIPNHQPLLSASHELNQGRLRLRADADASPALPEIFKLQVTSDRSC